MTQTILGSGGAIGIPLAKELKKFNDQIRLVSRRPKKVNDTDELLAVDFNDPTQVEKAIAGSTVVYVTVGFEYRLKVWQRTWPPFMQAVIDACKKHKATLVFVDNVYLYAASAIPCMTEDSPIQPPSRKGEVRKQIHEMIMSEAERGNLSALIARSADFYGPDNNSSALKTMVADNLLQGKKAQAFGDVNRIHTFTYTPDAARAIALLGNTNDAYNQVWHVPTTKEPLTTLQWIEMIAKELHTEARVQKIPAWMQHMLGVFIPIMREFPEMLYQFEQDYVLDSSKFTKRFGIEATPPLNGVRTMLESAGAFKGSR